MSIRRHQHRKKQEFLEGDDKIDLTPMIDIVFLLLAFFMVTTDFTQEADIGVKLPARAVNTSDDAPEELIVDIRPSGEILLNGSPIDHLNSREMPELTRSLAQLKKSADRLGQKTAVTILADPDSLHQRTVDVLNSCSTAGIKYVTFGE